VIDGSGWKDETILQNIGGGVFMDCVKAAISANLAFMCPITLLPASKAVRCAQTCHPDLPCDCVAGVT